MEYEIRLPRANYPRRLVQALGCVQIFLGLCSIFLQSAGIAYQAHLAEYGTGIWTGILFIVSGGIQLASANGSVCLITSSMVLGIVSATVTSLVLLSAAFGLHFDSFASFYFAYHKEVEGKVAVNASLICIAVLEAVVSIWGSALSCGAVCCKSPHAQRKLL